MRSTYAEGRHAHIMEVMHNGALEAERRMVDPFRKFSSLLTKARLHFFNWILSLCAGHSQCSRVWKGTLNVVRN